MIEKNGHFSPRNNLCSTIQLKSKQRTIIRKFETYKLKAELILIAVIDGGGMRQEAVGSVLDFIFDSKLSPSMPTRQTRSGWQPGGQ